MKKTNKKKVDKANKKKVKKMFVFVEVFLIALIFIVLFLLYQGGILGNVITFKAISEFEEGEGVELINNVNEIDYELGLEREFEFFVLNPEHRNMQVLLNVEGELNSSISLYDKIVDFLPSDDKKSFKYLLNLNEELEPGLHSAKIIALEVPRVSDKGYVSSSSKVVSEIKVYVPYPGKFVEADLNVLNAEQNSSADFEISVFNRGESKIDNVMAVIEIYTLLKEKIEVIETNQISLEALSDGKLNANWPVNVLLGDYIARVNILYDDEKKEFEKKFAVGAKNLEIQGLLVNNFQLGEIAKLQILVENKWNQELDEVFANLQVYNKDNQVIVDIRSAVEKISSLNKKELVAYWDTANVDEGEYNARLIINYNGEISKKDLVFIVTQDSLEVFGIGYVIRPNIMKGANLTMVLLILVIILLIVNLYWFIYMRRILGRRK